MSIPEAPLGFPGQPSAGGVPAGEHVDVDAGEGLQPGSTLTSTCPKISDTVSRGRGRPAACQLAGVDRRRPGGGGAPPAEPAPGSFKPGGAPGFRPARAELYPQGGAEELLAGAPPGRV
jgi:hypothetical protein